MCAVKVLLIEDDPVLRKLCSNDFELNQLEVVVAEDGLEGVNMARRENPDVIVLDVMLPKMDGYKVCRILKSDSRSKSIPIIMHTTRMGEQDKRMGMDAGAEAFVVKNNNVSDLITAIKELTAEKGAK